MGVVWRHKTLGVMNEQSHKCCSIIEPKLMAISIGLLSMDQKLPEPAGWMNERRGEESSSNSCMRLKKLHVVLYCHASQSTDWRLRTRRVHYAFWAARSLHSLISRYSTKLRGDVLHSIRQPWEIRAAFSRSSRILSRHCQPRAATRSITNDSDPKLHHDGRASKSATCCYGSTGAAILHLPPCGGARHRCCSTAQRRSTLV